MLVPTWAVGFRTVIPPNTGGGGVESLRAHPLSLQEVARSCVVSSKSGRGEEEGESGPYP